MKDIIYIYRDEEGYYIRVIPERDGIEYRMFQFENFVHYVSDVFYNISKGSNPPKIRNETYPKIDKKNNFIPIDARDMMLIYAKIALDKARHP